MLGEMDLHDSPIFKAILPPPLVPNLPAPVEWPKRVTSETLNVTAEILDGNSYDAAVRSLHAKLVLEDERMRRLLPPAPRGTEWHVYVEEYDASLDAKRTSSSWSSGLVLRLVYRLREIP